jgi:tetratricopeptide (TPR) repeat protein/predicted Ser/Thr protein kinase
MDPQRWAVIEPLYHAALAKEPGERSSYLASACAEDPELQSEIESLLACADVELTSPAQRSEVAKLWDSASTRISGQVDALPAAIGHYRIIRLLGEGGMGIVYEAEQEQPRRTVALKVIKSGLAAAELLRRFEQESQALGRLQHPGIAQIYEAGTADSGSGPQPYFAMEFIRGESLLHYAEAHQLNTRQRLEVMAKVCEAVHHAHQRGIIHRDLKPGNILVDESGQPKILDFGVARVTDSDAQATGQTDVGQIVGTLSYMSPEQVLGDPLELDTRSDVYALGVILYELLAGRPPYKPGTHLHEAVETIRHEDPAPLRLVSRNYRGDIETIVAKALEKDKGRRYASAAGMAEDIRRHLNDEPIVARPPSATYQFRKFARRHRALMAGGAAVFVVLIAGIIASTLEAARARRAEQVALRESATAEAVNGFLQNDLLAQASAKVQAQPDTEPDPDLKVRTALDRAATRINGKFAAQPLVEASIRQTIGNAYRDLGLFPEAQRQVERALELRQRALGERHRYTLTSMHELAELYRYQGDPAKAEKLHLQTLEIQRRVLGEEHHDTLDTMDALAQLYTSVGKYAQAEPLCIKALDTRRRTLGEEHPDTLASMSGLGMQYWLEGKYAQAEPLWTKVLEGHRRVLGQEHPDTLTAMNNLGTLYQSQGRYAEAEPLFAKALEIQRRVLGDEHHGTLNTMNNLGTNLGFQGKYAQAEPLFAKLVEGQRRALGGEHPETLISMSNLTMLYGYEGKYAQAEPLFTKLLEVERRALGEQHPYTLFTMNNLALLYRYQGKYSQAEPLYIKLLDLQRRVLGAEHPRRLASMNDLALLYLNQRKDAQAEALLREALNSHEKGKTDTWVRYNCQSLLGASLAGQKEYAEAEGLLVSGYEGMERRTGTIPAANRFRLEQAGKQIVELYRNWGKPEKAAEWRKRWQGTRPASSTQ